MLARGERCSKKVGEIEKGNGEEGGEEGEERRGREGGGGEGRGRGGGEGEVEGRGGATGGARGGSVEKTKNRTSLTNILLQHDIHRNTVQYTSSHSDTLSQPLSCTMAKPRSVRGSTSTHCNTLQHTATNGNARQQSVPHLIVEEPQSVRVSMCIDTRDNGESQETHDIALALQALAARGSLYEHVYIYIHIYLNIFVSIHAYIQYLYIVM